MSVIGRELQLYTMKPVVENIAYSSLEQIQLRALVSELKIYSAEMLMTDSFTNSFTNNNIKYSNCRETNFIQGLYISFLATVKSVKIKYFLLLFI